MGMINNIEVRAGDKGVEASVNLLSQINELYSLLDNVLPAGQLKEDMLSFISRKREEYIRGITSK